MMRRVAVALFGLALVVGAYDAQQWVEGAGDFDCAGYLLQRDWAFSSWLVPGLAGVAGWWVLRRPMPWAVPTGVVLLAVSLVWYAISAAVGPMNTIVRAAGTAPPRDLPGDPGSSSDVVMCVTSSAPAPAMDRPFALVAVIGMVACVAALATVVRPGPAKPADAVTHWARGWRELGLIATACGLAWACFTAEGLLPSLAAVCALVACAVCLLGETAGPWSGPVGVVLLGPPIAAIVLGATDGLLTLLLGVAAGLVGSVLYGRRYVSRPDTTETNSEA
ncbi:hypothetical protein [Cryptosporangium sp. NPDC051539]|uniref:hypothetical protein n=1 Tax=Cryptosporangium sp. NPDC051539 TaxID=3363962 RepID=UPI0037B819FD